MTHIGDQEIGVVSGRVKHNMFWHDGWTWHRAGQNEFKYLLCMIDDITHNATYPTHFKGL